MKTNPFVFDMRLHSIIRENQVDRFTTKQLRDAYAQRLGAVDYRLADVRRYVYEQIRRLVRVGWVVLDEKRRSRDQVYHLQQMPENLVLQLVETGFEDSLKPKPKPKGAIARGQEAKGGRKESSGCDGGVHLERLLKEIKLDFLSAMGEAERYKQLICDLPHIRPQVEANYLEARDRSSRLLGHLRAIENTLLLIEPAE
tara:strand:+ start:3941 stop:4537 length:597 start_codon:yes stop_codon:yes gene_type:complete